MSARLAPLVLVLCAVAAAPAAAGTFDVTASSLQSCTENSTICSPSLFTYTATGAGSEGHVAVKDNSALDWSNGNKMWHNYFAPSNTWTQVTYAPKVTVTAVLSQRTEYFACLRGDGDTLCLNDEETVNFGPPASPTGYPQPVTYTLGTGLSTAAPVRVGLRYVGTSGTNNGFTSAYNVHTERAFWAVTDNVKPTNLSIELGGPGVDAGQTLFNRADLGAADKLSIALDADDNVAVTERRLTDNGAALDPATGLADGQHSLVFTAYDRSDVAATRNSETLSRTVAVDTAAPATSPLTAASAHRTGTPTIEFQATDPAVNGYASGLADATASLYVDGFPVAAQIVRDGSVFRATPSAPLTDGRHTIALAITDVAGNRVAPGTGGTVDIDTRPPDGDGDGVIDAQDRCPAEHAAKADAAPRDGCVDELSALVDPKFAGRNGRVTTLPRVVVSFAAAGSTVTLRCVGKGCSFKAQTVRLASARTITFKALRKGRLGKRAFRILVTVTRPDHRGVVSEIYVRRGMTPGQLRARQKSACTLPQSTSRVTCRG